MPANRPRCGSRSVSQASPADRCLAVRQASAISCRLPVAAALSTKQIDVARYDGASSQAETNGCGEALLRARFSRENLREVGDIAAVRQL